MYVCHEIKLFQRVGSVILSYFFSQRVITEEQFCYKANCWRH